jgi:hypothetical protein
MVDKKRTTNGLILKERKSFWENNEEKIRLRYEKEGPGKLAAEFGVKPKTVTKHAQRLGLLSATASVRRRNKNSLRIDLFQTWSSEMAYLLGYIWADGCIKIETGHHTLQLACQTKDEELLLIFRDHLRSNHQLSRRERTTKKGFQSKYSQLTIHSKELVQSLLRLGLEPAKSKKDLLPTEIPDAFQADFVRGYFDGDGCISTYGTGVSCFSLMGTERCVRLLQRLIVEAVGVSTGKVAFRKNSPRIFATRWSAQKDLDKIGRWLYPGILALRRKKDKFLSVLTV